VGIWILWPNAGFWPLVIILLPLLVVRKLIGNLLRRTNLDIPLAIFIVTALLGVWAAYDTQSAWAKFWILIGGVLLYYVMVAQPESNWPVIGIAAGVLGLILLLTLLLTFDWSSQPADYASFDNFRIYLASIEIPEIEFELTPNKTAGILIIVLPLLVASTWSFLKRKHSVLTIVSGVLSVFLILGLLLTSSRGAWIGLLIAVTISILFFAFNRVRATLPKSKLTAIALGVGLSGFVFLYGLWTIQDSLIPSFNSIVSIGSRITLLRHGYLLIADFPVIGAGLQTFSGLYSRLILLLPVEFFHHAHNLYIDLAIEQGLPGLLAFVVFLSGGLVFSIDTLRNPTGNNIQSFALASFIGIVAMLFHGIFDDPIYGRAGTPLLFMTSGMTMAVFYSQPAVPNRTTKFLVMGTARLTKAMVPLAGVLLLLLAMGISKLRSIWFSNLGAIEMNKAELEHWPHVSWQESDFQYAALTETRSTMESAIQLDPNNQTAQYRLGLMAMNEGDYVRASDYLVSAFDQKPTHRGIIKALGYSYLWSGRPPQAMSLLLQIPESRYELGAYSWWWETQGEMDLASAAINMASALEESGAPLTSNPFVVEYSVWEGGSY
jgi:putative inorganic carbon (HCO3(-)) transporter